MDLERGKKFIFCSYIDVANMDEDAMIFTFDDEYRRNSMKKGAYVSCVRGVVYYYNASISSFGTRDDEVDMIAQDLRGVRVNCFKLEQDAGVSRPTPMLKGLHYKCVDSLKVQFQVVSTDSEMLAPHFVRHLQLSLIREALLSRSQFPTLNNCVPVGIRVLRYNEYVIAFRDDKSSIILYVPKSHKVTPYVPFCKFLRGNSGIPMYVADCTPAYTKELCQTMINSPKMFYCSTRLRMHMHKNAADFVSKCISTLILQAGLKEWKNDELRKIIKLQLKQIESGFLKW